MPTMEKENTEKQTKQNAKTSGFVLHFGGDHRHSSIEIENTSDPQITVNFKDKSKRLSLKELAILMEIYG